NDGTIHTELQGEKPNQDTVDQRITGTNSNDRLMGKAGNDTLRGGAGDDELYGADKPGGSFENETGNDTLHGGEGNDKLFGGDGEDLAQYDQPIDESMITTNGGGWTVTTGGEGTDTLSDIEIVAGAGGARFLLVGNGGFDTIQAAIDAAVDGDTILIAADTYAENLIVDKAVTLVGVGEVILQGTFTSSNGIAGTVYDHLKSGAYSAGDPAIQVTADDVAIKN